MRRFGAAGLIGVLLLVGACSADDTTDGRAPAPGEVRVTGPHGFSYAVVGEGWQVEPDDLRWTDERGRTTARLRAAASFDRGYAVGVCATQFSARAVAGWTRGLSHAHVVGRFVRAVGGEHRAGASVPTWRPALPDGTPVRLTRVVVEVPDGAPCRSDDIGLTVITLRAPGRGPHPSWVYVGDRGAAAPSEADVVSLAASLRGTARVG